MQSRRQSQQEVGIDFVISIVINLGIQAIFLRSFTLQKGLGFTAVFLFLSVVRRYIVRRSFNRWVGIGGQSRRVSLLESFADTLVAVLMAFGLLMAWYPDEAGPRMSALVVASYAVTLLRRYLLRRLFEWRMAAYNR